jgi:Na+/H+ antiporter NhaD/arsenite permease-like protein
MRPGTILVLLGLIVLFAYFGFQFFSFLLAFFLLTLIVGILTVVLGIWLIKRRMRRKLAELGVAVEERLRRQAEQDRTLRPDAIDVEGTVRRPRDGADEPED